MGSQFVENVTPPLQEQIDNKEMRRAIRLLVDAVTREFRPDGHALKQAASSLRHLLDTPSPQSFSQAAAAFNAIDGETRRRIRANAEDAATVFCTRTGQMVVPKPAPSPSPPQPPPALAADPSRKLATGLLHALNTGFNRPGKGLADATKK
jgi:hypothetical protein